MQSIEAIETLTQLLHQEIEAIGQGDLSQIEDMLPRKADLLDRIEADSDELAVALAADDDSAEDLRGCVATLRGLLARDLALLGRMQATAGDIATEISRIRDRHGLSGLYGSTGARRANDTISKVPLDRTV